MKISTIPDYLKCLWYTKYYRMSNTRGLAHSANSISNNCQKISSWMKNEAKISKNKVTNSILKNWIYSLSTLLTTKQPKNDFLKKDDFKYRGLSQISFKDLLNFSGFTFSVSFRVFFNICLQSLSRKETSPLISWNIKSMRNTQRAWETQNILYCNIKCQPTPNQTNKK